MIKFAYQGSGWKNWQDKIGQYDSQFLVGLYENMLRIRRIEEGIESRYHEDQMKTPIHLVIGMEASSVGSCAALDKRDLLFCGHRTHGQYLAKGGDLRKMMAEFFCRSTGSAGSRGGSMHLLDKSVGMEGSSAIVGGAVPIAVGAALAIQMKKEKRVVALFFGDAATEEGVVWESLNFAALKKLPILFICENNFYSVCSPLEFRQPPGVEIHKKAAAFGVPSQCVDGTNVLDVFEAVRIAKDRAMTGQGPSFIETRSYRWRGHGGAGDDSHTGYRDPEEVKAWQKYCPIDTFSKELKSRGILTESTVQQIEERIKVEFDEAFLYGQNSPDPVENDLYRHVYSD
ncbi:Pyruvate dehydrogenase E1 component alpha subunit [Leptospirillum ferriphilum]|jgi:pyruvate dehydrogenase E1 component alpha subunit|uniref:Pyruvate dehydrogenase E1 component alpha subunit n=3 Tax=Leptospirillum ferriphilum TaxID=178606 RepID=A0A094YHF6_9BACT|nr:thiamine pyrophosphate-dependent dehydrogenase E1 component subunit alpha [Leptospirillum ferriphilum]AFS53973.1 acetoin:2,6-dichlorophenolindophenol oxidoreductase subunit alpha [Leptospirillum ferriphilum ML-04]KGA92621.1 Pyruvate dehydrogenase E1 component alpha subunit [Leptospirillum ferriphilum]